MLITSEELLSNLPTALLVWTAITLCWGVYINIAFHRMMAFADKYKKGRRPADVCNSKFITLANLILGTYLLFEPHLVPMGDAIVVINVFYSAYLLAASTTIARWWKTKDKHKVEHLTSDEHILT